MALKASELTPGQTFTAVVVEDLKRTQFALGDRVEPQEGVGAA